MIKNIETRKINWTIVGARVSSAQFCLNLEKINYYFQAQS